MCCRGWGRTGNMRITQCCATLCSHNRCYAALPVTAPSLLHGQIAVHIVCRLLRAAVGRNRVCANPKCCCLLWVSAQEFTDVTDREQGRGCVPPLPTAVVNDRDPQRATRPPTTVDSTDTTHLSCEIASRSGAPTTRSTHRLTPSDPSVRTTMPLS